ncbi:GTP pyrophosphokinase family protein [Paenibacillus sp. NPDC056579]|uniref:GTP pyrophosphokinase n=1 Tax=Paenibacillus sp. NPDC056579 TaxID=3345871 RepID=UPI00367E176F
MLLDDEGLTYYSISSREKTMASFMSKASKDKYTDPLHQITDLAGIRVITYVKSEVYQCCEAIKQLFKIDEQNSGDKTTELGTDKVGYRSVHYVATLTEDRAALREILLYKDLRFEIQVRTILEHAWADIAHDRSYKYKGKFPAEYDIERRFSLASATLELVDREFDSIAKALEEYEQETAKKTKDGELNIPINATTLLNYLNKKLLERIRFGKINPVFGTSGLTTTIDELLLFGISTINDLDQLIDATPPDLVFYTNDFTDFLRLVMITIDADKFFGSAYRDLMFVMKDKWVHFLSNAGVTVWGK